ncbi:hypothetical protein BDZ91DRAFT_745947, partial [Kalaharituber pfeilii]
MVLKSRYISLSPMCISWAFLPLLNRSDSTSLPFIPFVNTSIYQKDSAYFDTFKAPDHHPLLATNI